MTLCTYTDDCAPGFNPVCECDSEECGCTPPAGMIGVKREVVFNRICEFLDDNYEMDKVWKQQEIKTIKWKYEYKYSKNGKTLCSFYTTDDCLGHDLV